VLGGGAAVVTNPGDIIKPADNGDSVAILEAAPELLKSIEDGVDEDDGKIACWPSLPSMSHSLPAAAAPLNLC